MEKFKVLLAVSEDVFALQQERSNEPDKGETIYKWLQENEFISPEGKVTKLGRAAILYPGLLDENL